MILILIRQYTHDDNSIYKWEKAQSEGGEK